MITTANGREVSAPTACDNAIGNNPKAAINAVITTGRARERAPSRTASGTLSPWAAQLSNAFD